METYKKQPELYDPDELALIPTMKIVKKNDPLNTLRPLIMEHYTLSRKIHGMKKWGTKNEKKLEDYEKKVKPIHFIIINIINPFLGKYLFSQSIFSLVERVNPMC